MHKDLTRRDFLKLSGLSLGGLAFSKSYEGRELSARDAISTVRVSVDEVRIFKEPSYHSDVVSTRPRDQLLYIYEKFVNPDGPDFNPNWYRLDDGFAHTAYLQPVETQLNQVLSTIPDEGQVFEVSVPLTQSYRDTKARGWEKLYRLYYKSNHWVTGIIEGPDGALWYQLTDELLYINYYVLASHMRPVPNSEFAPIAADVPPGHKRVEVSIAEQRLWAYEADELVMDTKISTGIPGLATTNGIPTATPRGSFNIISKMPVRHMGNGQVTSDVFAYELPGVPWVSYFHETGVAFHGTFWHDNYGNEMSHGCVNMLPEEAKWLFRWLTPANDPGERIQKGYGTRVIVT
jgi:hypothetical protein